MHSNVEDRFSRLSAELNGFKSELVSKRRGDIYQFFRQLSQEEGVLVARSVVSKLAGRIYHRIYMQAGQEIFRAKNEFQNEVAFLEEVYKDAPRDLYVAQALARSYFSVGEISKASAILLNSFSFQNFREFIGRSIEAILNMGEYESAEELLKHGMSQNLIAEDVAHCYYGRIKKSVSGKPAGVRDDVPVYCLNLDSDTRKWALIEQLHVKRNRNVERISAVLGRSLPSAARKLVDPKMLFASSPGTVGCFLTHVNAWERVAEGLAEYALIIEDDGLPFYDFSVNDLVGEVGKEFDLLYVNERMSSLRGGVLLHGGATDIASRLETLKDSQQGWGGDGYVLSRVGANKLLEFFSKDLILGHVDGQIGAYGVPFGYPKNNRALTTANVFRSGSKVAESLDISCLNFPAIHQINFGFSSRSSS